MARSGDKTKTVRRRAQAFDEENTFVRSRTISSYDITADNQRQAAQLERGKQKKRQARHRKVLAGLFVLLALLVVFAFAMSQYIYGISNVVYDKAPVSRLVDPGKYAAIAEDYLAQHPTSRFSFFFRAEDFAKYLSEQAPEVDTSALDIRPFMGGELRLAFREPVAVWESLEGRKYVDASGTAFENNFMAEPTVVIKDENSLGVDNVTVASGRFLNFIGQVIAGVNTSGAGQVESVSIPLGAIRYVELRLTGRSYPIKIQIDRDPASQTGDIINMLKYLDEHKIAPSYVDVRIENRGYWK